MLMFITVPSERYSIAEEVQMALEGGCRWIQLRLDNATDEEFRQTAQEVIPMCQEHEAFLVFDGHAELAMEMSVHGVNLAKGQMNPLQAREMMGAEAIIGITATNAADVLNVRTWDVDYAEVTPFATLGAEGCDAIVKKVREADMLLPLVAVGGVTVDDIPAIMETGINGVAVGKAIVSAADPVEYVRSLLAALEKYKPSAKYDR